MASGMSLLTQTQDLWREKNNNSRPAAELLDQWYKFNWGLVCHACLWWSEKLHLQKKIPPLTSAKYCFCDFVEQFQYVLEGLLFGCFWKQQPRLTGVFEQARSEKDGAIRVYQSVD